jgi:hypothetical protein
MQRFINNWTATLTAPAASAAPELTIAPDKAAELVGLGTGDYYLLNLAKVVDDAEVDWEIVKVTAAASGVLDVERGQEGTTALDWLTGEPISARFTAGSADELRTSGGAAVGDATPLALGPPAAGTSELASREDHRHALPTAADIGAATAAQGGKADTAVQPAALAAGLDGKVDKVAGKQLSQEDFTSTLRTKLVGLESPNFRGTFTTFAAMVAEVASPVAGNYADVDAGAGSDVVRYIWDATDSEWQTGAGGGGPASTDSLPEGLTNLYHTETRVRGTVLTGISFLDDAIVAATDNVLQAIGKLAARLATKMTNPMTTEGDLIVGGASGAPARRAAGGAGTMLISLGSGLAPIFGYNPLLGGYTEIYEVMADNAINVATSAVKKRVLTAASTITITGAVSARCCSFTLMIEAGSTYAVTWPASFKWIGGVPALTAKDVITGFSIDGGTTWIVSYVGSYV